MTDTSTPLRKPADGTKPARVPAFIGKERTHRGPRLRFSPFGKKGWYIVWYEIRGKVHGVLIEANSDAGMSLPLAVGADGVVVKAPFHDAHPWRRQFAVGDVIKRADGRAVNTVQDFRDIIEEAKGRRIELRVFTGKRGTRKCLRKAGTSREDAERFYRHWLSQREAQKHGIALPITPAAMTFAQLADEAVKWAHTPQSGYSPGWARQVEYLLRAHTEQWGVMPLVSITPSSLGKWADKRGTEVAGKTLANEIHALRAAFKLAVTRQYLPADPSAALKIPKARATRPKFLTEEQVQLLLDCAVEADQARLQPRQSSKGGAVMSPAARQAAAMRKHYNEDGTFDTARIRFLLLTALRKNQLTSLTWSQYDSARGMITLESRSDHTEKSRRVSTIPLPKEARDIIIGQPRHSEYVFPNLDGGRDSEIASRFKRIAARMVAKGGAHVHLHLLRHTALTRFLQHTHDIAAVQAYAGHATIATTQRYAWVLPSTLKALTETFTFQVEGKHQHDQKSVAQV